MIMRVLRNGSTTAMQSALAALTALLHYSPAPHVDPLVDAISDITQRCVVPGATPSVARSVTKLIAVLAGVRQGRRIAAKSIRIKLFKALQNLVEHPAALQDNDEDILLATSNVLTAATLEEVVAHGRSVIDALIAIQPEVRVPLRVALLVS